MSIAADLLAKAETAAGDPNTNIICSLSVVQLLQKVMQVVSNTCCYSLSFHEAPTWFAAPRNGSLARTLRSLAVLLVEPHGVSFRSRCKVVAVQETALSDPKLLLRLLFRDAIPGLSRLCTVVALTLLLIVKRFVLDRDEQSMAGGLLHLT